MNYLSYLFCAFVLTCICTWDVLCDENPVIPVDSLLGRWRKGRRIRKRSSFAGETHFHERDIKMPSDQTEAISYHPLDFVLTNGSLLDIVIINSEHNKKKKNFFDFTPIDKRLQNNLVRRYRIDSMLEEKDGNRRQSSLVHRIINYEDLGLVFGITENKYIDGSESGKKELYGSILARLIERLNEDMGNDPQNRFTYLLSALNEANRRLQMQNTNTEFEERLTMNEGSDDSQYFSYEKERDQVPGILGFHLKQSAEKTPETNLDGDRRVNDKMTSESPTLESIIQRIFDVISSMLSFPDPNRKEQQASPSRIIESILNTLKSYFPDGIFGLDTNIKVQNDSKINNNNSNAESANTPSSGFPTDESTEQVPNMSADISTFHKIIIEEEKGQTKFSHHKYVNEGQSFRTFVGVNRRETPVDDSDMMPIAYEGQVLVPRAGVMLDFAKESDLRPTFRNGQPVLTKENNPIETNVPPRQEAGNQASQNENPEMTQPALSNQTSVRVSPDVEIRQDILCRCGVPQKKRVINGTTTNIRKYPWMVQLKSTSDYFFCGGSIITDDFVLTAAHCVSYTNPQDMVVVVAHTSSQDPGWEVGVEDIIVHKGYEYWAIEYNDIALIKLNEVLKFSDKVMPVCLPEHVNYLEGQKGIIAGWGVFDDTGDTSDVLREHSVTILEKDTCRKEAEYPHIEIHSLVICGKRPSVDTCQGDSGGPMSIEQNGVHIQVGITSWGYGCAESPYPGVYTKVAAFYEWIRGKTHKSRYCLGPEPRTSLSDVATETPEDLPTTVDTQITVQDFLIEEADLNRTEGTPNESKATTLRSKQKT